MEQFVAFLGDLVAQQPAGQEMHVIADNLTVRLHFTPTCSSWLTQVELWFGKISRDVINRGVFSPVADLKCKLMRYIHEYNRKREW